MKGLLNNSLDAASPNAQRFTLQQLKENNIQFRQACRGETANIIIVDECNTPLKAVMFVGVGKQKPTYRLAEFYGKGRFNR